MFTFDLTNIFLLTFLEFLILHLRSISTRIENKFRKLPPFYYIGVDSTYLFFMSSAVVERHILT